MATLGKKKLAAELPECPYGARCYRKNPDHFIEFLHPKKVKFADPELDEIDAVVKPTTSKAAPIKAASIDDSALPPCKYGAKCYRKNLLHYAEYAHPTSVKDAVDSGSDTDVVSDEDEPGKKAVNFSDILKNGDLLVKSYTVMTEFERKELIKQAIAAKKALQEELDKTKEEVKKKDKELDRLNKEVATGMLLMDGEKEALEGKKTVYFALIAERKYKEGSTDQIHFRLAESQFYRLLTGASYQITKVEYVVNPELKREFQVCRDDLKKTRGEEFSYPVLAFHGTKQEFITPICENGFKIPGQDKGHKHRTDTGWYGQGVYFSEYPSYSMSYIQGATKLLLCQVLPGKRHSYGIHVHVCTLDIVTMSLDKDMAISPWHYGVLGGFLSDTENNIYGVTCAHVTRAASDGIMYLKNSDCYVPFGETMTSDVDPETDIDIFVVDKRFHSTIYEAHEHVDVFSGTVQDLYCIPVYSVSANKIYSANTETQSTLWRNSLGNGSEKVGDLQLKYSGRIAPAEVHRKLELPEHVFLIDCAPGSNFAPGDSGTMVALDTVSEGVMLVGIVAGEYMYMNSPDESAVTNIKYITCVLFSYGLQCIRAMYGMNLTVYQSNKNATKAVTPCRSSTIVEAKANRKNQDNCVFPGHIIWVKTPESIKQIDFVITEHVILLINACFDDNMDPEELAMEMAFERQLSDSVSSREAIDDMYDNPAQQCYVQCILGCNNLYSGDYRSSEKHFKSASKLIVTTSCKKRLLCRLVTYVTWQLLDLEQLQELGEFLKYSEQFMLEMQQDGVCPASSIGYFYHDYTYYYLECKQPATALIMAEKALYYTRMKANDSADISVSTSLALGLVARINLGCGEHFEEKNTPIDAEKIRKAEVCLHEGEGKKLCAVQTVDYLLTKSDLEYRHGNIAEALKLARQCQHAASSHDLKSGVDQSTVRIEALMQMLA